MEFPESEVLQRLLQLHEGNGLFEDRVPGRRRNAPTAAGLSLSIANVLWDCVIAMGERPACWGTLGGESIGHVVSGDSCHG